jgi:hypothetical protein
LGIYAIIAEDMYPAHVETVDDAVVVAVDDVSVYVLLYDELSARSVGGTAYEVSIECTSIFRNELGIFPVRP